MKLYFLSQTVIRISNADQIVTDLLDWEYSGKYTGISSTPPPFSASIFRTEKQGSPGMLSISSIECPEEDATAILEEVNKADEVFCPLPCNLERAVRWLSTHALWSQTQCLEVLGEDPEQFKDRLMSWAGVTPTLDPKNPPDDLKQLQTLISTLYLNLNGAFSSFVGPSRLANLGKEILENPDVSIEKVKKYVQDTRAVASSADFLAGMAKEAAGLALELSAIAHK